MSDTFTSYNKGRSSTFYHRGQCMDFGCAPLAHGLLCYRYGYNNALADYTPTLDK